MEITKVCKEREHEVFPFLISGIGMGRGICVNNADESEIIFKCRKCGKEFNRIQLSVNGMTWNRKKEVTMETQFDNEGNIIR